MRLLNLLVVCSGLLVGMSPTKAIYQPVMVGYFEVFYKGEYVQSIRRYQINYAHGEFYYCFMPNSILNSGKEAKIMVCYLRELTEIKEYNR
jgi:hypothetical protein